MRRIALGVLFIAACTGGGGGGTGDEPRVPVFGTPRWAIALGGTGHDGGDTIALHPSGDVIVGGYFSRTVDFGDGPMTEPGQFAGGFLTRRSGVDGSPVWTVTLTGWDAEVMGVATDADGDVIAIGVYSGTIDFGGQTLSVPAGMSESAFVAEYDPDGNLLWVNGFDDSVGASGRAVATGRDGAVYATGDFHGTLDFGDGPVSPASGSSGSYVVAYNHDGSVRWGHALGNDIAQVWGNGIAVAPDSDVVITGTVAGPIDFGTGLIDVPASTQHSYAVRYTSSGSVIWANEYGDVGSAAPTPAFDAVGQIVLGTTEGDGRATTRLLDDAGREHWVTDPDPEGTQSRALGVQPDGTSIQGGHINGADIDFGTGTIAGYGTMFLVAHASDGTVLDAVSYGVGQPTNEVATGIVALSDGSVAFTGSFERTIDFGSGNLAAVDNEDIVIVMLDPP